jgi:hypothetical protein
MPTFTQIGSAVVVGSGGQAAITFSAIPATYTDLVVALSTRTNNGNAAEALTLTINSTNGTSRYLFNAAGTVGSGTDTVIFGGTSTGAGATASTFSSSSVYITNYANTSTNKALSIDYTSENNSTDVTQILNAGLWANNAAITSLTFTPFSGSTLVQHSTAYLYGVSNA